MLGDIGQEVMQDRYLCLIRRARDGDLCPLAGGALREAPCVGVPGSLQLLAAVQQVDNAGGGRLKVLGGLQVVLTTTVIALLAGIFGVPLRTAIFLGLLAALSSTAIVLKAYSDRRELQTPQGGLVTGILGFMLLPIMAAIWGRESQGVLFVHNVGVETAMWTVGVLILSGLSLREGWKKLLNPIMITLIAAVLLNRLGVARQVPQMVYDVAHALAVCAIPLGLLTVGVSLANYLGEPRALFQPRVSIAACTLPYSVCIRCCSVSDSHRMSSVP